MSEATIDVTTGLPEVPEGYFWRVGKIRVEDYGFSSQRYTRTIEGVALIKKTVKVTHKERPIYGDKWYNAWRVVETVIDEVKDVTEKVYAYEEFDETYLLMDDELPEYAGHSWEETTWINDTDTRKTTKYHIAVNEAGISYLADRIHQRFMKNEEDRLNRERLFGDYPPKTLAGV